VHISELGGDYYKFDESRFELRGERTGVRYSIGDKVHVQVSRVDLDARRMDFRLLKGRFAGGAAGGTPLGKAVIGKSVMGKAAAAKPKRRHAIDNEAENIDGLITTADLTSQLLPDSLPRGGSRQGAASKPGHAAVTQNKAAAKAKVKRVRAAPKKKR
jgi:ribonuclease R